MEDQDSNRNTGTERNVPIRRSGRSEIYYTPKSIPFLSEGCGQRRNMIDEEIRRDGIHTIVDTKLDRLLMEFAAFMDVTNLFFAV